MRRPFGALVDGSAIDAMVLDSGGLRAEVLSYGGILRSLSLSLAGQRRELVLGLPGLDDYERDAAYLGCIVGRYSNRIAASRFELDGRSHHLKAHEGANHLHGGPRGFGKQTWRVLELQGGARPMLRLGHRSAAGDEGYPGTLEVEAKFSLSQQRLDLLFTARTDAATPLSLTYHPYFNLAGDPQVPAGQQLLQVTASRFLPVDAALLPTGELAAVARTPFDFRSGRAAADAAGDGHAQLRLAGGFDHCLVPDAGADCAAELYSPHSGVRMRIRSDAPGLQFYGGHGLHRHHPQLGSGLCLEPQAFPDAPNQAQFPSAVLRPGEIYTRRISYEFDTVRA
jgi:aldose 1-epimerase